MAYVIVDGVSKRCRAKDPAHCRYHKNADGTPMTHYASKAEADAILEKQHAGSGSSVSSSLSKSKAATAETKAGTTKAKTAKDNVDKLGIDASSWTSAPVAGVMPEADVDRAEYALAWAKDLDAKAQEAIGKLDTEAKQLRAKASRVEDEIIDANRDVAAVVDMPDVVALRNEISNNMEGDRQREAEMTPVDRIRGLIESQKGKPAEATAVAPLDLVGDERYARAIHSNEMDRLTQSAYYSDGDLPAVEKPSIIDGVEEYTSAKGPRLKISYRNVGKNGRMGKARYFTIPADMASTIKATHAADAKRLEELAVPSGAASASRATWKAYDEARTRQKDAYARAKTAWSDARAAEDRLSAVKNAREEALALSRPLAAAVAASKAAPATLPVMPESEHRVFAVNPGETAPSTAANKLNREYEDLAGDADWHAYDPKSGWARITSHEDRWWQYAEFTGYGSGRAHDSLAERLVNVKTGEALNVDADVAKNGANRLRAASEKLEALLSERQ